MLDIFNGPMVLCVDAIRVPLDRVESSLGFEGQNFREKGR